MTVAPASITPKNTSFKNSGSDLVASSAENSTSSQKDLAYLTDSTACSSTSSFVFLSLYFICISLVAIKTCILGFLAYCRADHATSISFFTDLASPHTVLFFISFDMIVTASTSPGEAIGKPASITSTPISSSCLAILSFS